MNSKAKKSVGAAGGLAAAAAATAIALSGGGLGNKKVEIPYTIESGAYTTVMTVTPPENASIDIVKLYCNGVEVDKAQLPDESLRSIPVVFSDKERLMLRMYRKGEQVGVAEFDEGRLYYRKEQKDE